MDLRLLSAQTHLFCVGGRHAAKTISYNLLICIALGFVAATDDAARSHQSLVRWSRVRADVICIIQSALHKCAQLCVCVIAPVSLEEPKVLPRSAKEAPRALSCAKALPGQQVN